MRNRTRIAAITLGSAICASALVWFLAFLSQAFIRRFPYHDLPMVPKPIFLFALLPGYLAGEQFDDPMVQNAVFYLANVLVYSTMFFLIQRFVARLLHDYRRYKDTRTDC
jgi:hypothetical protein